MKADICKACGYGTAHRLHVIECVEPKAKGRDAGASHVTANVTASVPDVTPTVTGDVHTCSVCGEPHRGRPRTGAERMRALRERKV